MFHGGCGCHVRGHGLDRDSRGDDSGGRGHSRHDGAVLRDRQRETRLLLEPSTRPNRSLAI